MPFIDFKEPDHSCRPPGRSVGYDATWYCPTCLWIWRFVECDFGDDSFCKRHYYNGHWEYTDKKFKEADNG